MADFEGSNRGKFGRLITSEDAFLAAAHELKSPLGLIRQLSLTLAEDTSLSPAEYERLLTQITLTAERALRLTNDLTRSSRQTMLFPVEPINPQQLCEEVAHELTPLYTAHDKTIRVAKRHRPTLAVGNRDLLRRILLNFGDNALYYTGNEEVVELRISTHPRQSQVRIGVRDFGPAVPPATWRTLAKRLKDLAPQPVHARPQSSGLGLWAAGQFALMMDSHIGAARHVDGASFYVELPMSHQLNLL
jgi:signal transduction histidine kinase